MGRRVRVLRDHLDELLPAGSRVLDVGCGDGLLAAALVRARPDLQIEGIDVLVRPGTAIPVKPYDGVTIPHPGDSFDAVMLVDVLHHTEDPIALLREAARVTRRGVLIKDHNREGLLAAATLRFMDWLGNERHGVALPYTYWRRKRWHAAFAEVPLEAGELRETLGLYPFPFDWFFGRSLHFVAWLSKPALPP